MGKLLAQRWMITTAIAVGLVSCGPADVMQPTSANSVSDVAPQVTTVGRTFEPAYIVVAPGANVTWHFASPHTVTFTAAKPLQGDVPGQQAGNVVARTFSEPGTYYYVCSYHAGMSGAIEVQSAGPGVVTPN